jgi:hypothetical protein
VSISPLASTNNQRKSRGRTKPFDITLQDFSGGLKTAENELALKNKYSVLEDNVFVNEDRSKSVRFGTKLFATTPANIIDTIYFADHIIAVLADGKITKTANDGTTTEIWNATIAAALPGAPSAWGATTQCDFTEFKRDLVVGNGSDKPVTIDQTLDVTYLQDLAVGTNVNTPIAKYTTTVGSYCVKAGVTNEPSTVIYISSSGTAGVWPGDAAPNNAISFDVGAYTGEGGASVIGLATFRNYLIVYFEDFFAALQLGQLDDSGNHIPQVVDTRDKAGTVNHRTILTLTDDLITLDRQLVYSAKRNVFGGAVETKPLSADVGKLLKTDLAQVDEDDTGSFVVHDRADQRIMFCLRVDADTLKVYTFSHDETMNDFSISTISGWNFQGGCSSRLDRTFFFKDTLIYQYGNDIFDGEDYAADFIGGTPAEGVAIDFDWQMPWMDANQRIKTKHLRNILWDTEGTGEFTFEIFVNKNLKDLDGNFIPVLSLPFRCGDQEGYGRDAPSYGSGRPANEERRYTMPSRFRTIKFRIRGSTFKPITINSLSLIYQIGNYHP